LDKNIVYNRKLTW